MPSDYVVNVELREVSSQLNRLEVVALSVGRRPLLPLSIF